MSSLHTLLLSLLFPGDGESVEHPFPVIAKISPGLGQSESEAGILGHHPSFPFAPSS